MSRNHAWSNTSKGNSRNTIGSYECGCPDATKTFVYGYLVDCQDIDECEGSNDCDISKSVCIKMEPGYLCQCLFGYANVDDVTCGEEGSMSTKSKMNSDHDEFDDEEIGNATAPGDESQRTNRGLKTIKSQQFSFHLSRIAS